MLNEFINKYNQIISAMPYFSNVYGIAESKESKGGVRRPVVYLNGKYQPIKLNTLGTSYFRKRADVTITEGVSSVSCNTVYTFTIPLRLFAIVKRSEFPIDDAYASDRLAATLIKGLTFKNGQIRKDIGAISAVSLASLYSTNSQTLMNEELTGVARSDFNYDDIVVGINLDITVNTYNKCIVDPCNYTPEFFLKLESYVALP